MSVYSLLIWLLQHWKAGENSFPGKVAEVRAGELGSGQCRLRRAALPALLPGTPMINVIMITLLSQIIINSILSIRNNLQIGRQRTAKS